MTITCQVRYFKLKAESKRPQRNSLTICIPPYWEEVSAVPALVAADFEIIFFKYTTPNFINVYGWILRKLLRINIKTYIGQISVQQSACAKSRSKRSKHEIRVFIATIQTIYYNF